MATERDPQAELEREIAALIRNRLPQAAGCDIAIDIIEKNNGAPGEVRIKFTPSAPAAADGAEESANPPAKPAPTKIKTQYPPGEFSPTIYPEGWPDRSKRRGFDFEPIKIRGKPLSETVMEDRGPEMPDGKPDPTKRKAKYPPGEFAPTIYPEGGGDPATRRPYDFPLIKIRGKPLSETVIEDRQAGW